MFTCCFVLFLVNFILSFIDVHVVLIFVMGLSDETAYCGMTNVLLSRTELNCANTVREGVVGREAIS